MKFRKILAFGAAVAVTTGGVVTLASPASAEQVVIHATEIPTRLVHFADLDLANRDGQRVLKRRVSTAVYAVCDGSESYATFQSDGFCRTAAWAKATPQIEAAIQRAQLMAENNIKDTGVQAIAISL
ncbi:UrcA family protein [Sphingomonas sp. HDW15A]|uniref:UrcA family protein n=1 Tax=Sphingomonas sp. HDW15A TaxID=2714942 RepID=UPI00140885F9|nr:UrcA family protein [Sphingomonas sp. HDW15A]QIK95637.1 UrcA family protein [Sphingomonas sp. HDW15A]